MSIKVLFIGAHPDDCEVYGGGTAALLARMGHEVKFISVTNGSAGHHRLTGGELINRRRQESMTAARILGVAYDIFDNPDGQLMPTLENRYRMIQSIRDWQADVVVTHRPNDYHPDHRYTSQLVQDAAYMVMVPNIVMQSQPLRKNPVFLYFADHFQKPNPFSPDIAVAIDQTYEKKFQALHAHNSQFYEWLPWVSNELKEVPASETARIEWLKQKWTRPVTSQTLLSLEKWYGKEKARQIQYAEAFEICEYGHQPDDETIRKLFPMLNE